MMLRSVHVHWYCVLDRDAKPLRVLSTFKSLSRPALKVSTTYASGLLDWLCFRSLCTGVFVCLCLVTSTVLRSCARVRSPRALAARSARWAERGEGSPALARTAFHIESFSMGHCISLNCTIIWKNAFVNPRGDVTDTPERSNSIFTVQLRNRCNNFESTT